jgi:hypothetical protein
MTSWTFYLRSTAHASNFNSRIVAQSPSTLPIYPLSNPLDRTMRNRVIPAYISSALFSSTTCSQDNKKNSQLTLYAHFSTRRHFSPWQTSSLSFAQDPRSSITYGQTHVVCGTKRKVSRTALELALSGLCALLDARVLNVGADSDGGGDDGCES